MSNRTWIVRGGTTGNGPTYFCVYAPTMEQARANAQKSLGDNARAGFTVHALRKGEWLPGSMTLMFNPYARVTPAPDYSPPIPA